jgi:TRAP-type C4-dicarboxylate transport system permease small subunit
LKATLTLLMGLMIVPVLLQILSRHTGGHIPRYIWTEEAARFCFVWIIMIGSVIAVREGTHFSVDLLPHARTRRWKAISNLLVHIVMILMALVFAWYGYGFAKFGFVQTSEMSGINMLSIYISFPLAGVSWALFLLEKIVEEFRQLSNPEPGERS